MKRLLLVLLPVALTAQVVVDTVIRLPSSALGKSIFLPELSKLYVASYPDKFFVIDCSSYLVRTQISVDMKGDAHYSWDWRGRKLYVTCNPYPDSTIVIDATADTVERWLADGYEMHTNVYLSDVDQLYRPAVESLYAYDGGTDTVVRRLRLGGANTCASWDSVGHKLYVGQGEGKKLYAYDYNADSVLKVVDLSEVSAVQPDACVFDYGRCKAYVASFQPEPWATDVGILDTKCDTLLGVLPVRIGEGLYEQVAVDQQDDKAYLADNDSYTNTPDTLWVVDCSTDSVIKKVEYEHRGYGATRLRWVPWSNRLYMGITYPDADHNSSMAILDCNTDSLIVPQMLLNDGYIQSFQLDPIHQRIFVTGVNDSEVVVLRDTGYGGVAESRPARPRQSSGLQVQVMPGWFDIRYSVSSPCRVNLSIYDLIGREVRRLVAENQPAGQHSVAWSCQGRDGKPVARGVYFLRLDTPAVRDVQKVVITR